MDLSRVTVRPVRFREVWQGEGENRPIDDATLAATTASPSQQASTSPRYADSV